MAKQISLAAATLLIACTTLTAQDGAFQQFKFGLQLSPSISWMTTDDSQIDGNGTALGLKLATQAEFFFAENYAIATGIGFHFNAGGTLNSNYGGRFFGRSIPEGEAFNQVTGTESGNVDIDYSIQYIEIPLALKLRTREFGYLTYYMEAPAFTLHIRSNATGELSGGGESANPEDINIEEEVVPLGLSWGFGGGVEYSVSESTRLFAGLQYQNIFTDVTRDTERRGTVYDGRTGSGDPDAAIHSITLLLGVLF